MRKYELGESKQFRGLTIYRIVALRDFSDVKTGDVGGWVAGKHNLSHEGLCWIYGNVVVTGAMQIVGNWCVYANDPMDEDEAVSVNAYVCGKAQISGNNTIEGDYAIPCAYLGQRTVM